jgi:choline transport protein
LQPSWQPVSATGMNYAFPIFAFVVIVALILWFVSARKHWPGLNKEIIDVVLADSDRNTVEYHH